jgi:NAD(P)-dependent dehydrogenase (short-subunit alcohol dehydrogenase family)
MSKLIKTFVRSFLDTPPLHVYGVSKAGVMGLMRSLRTQLPRNSNATINMVAPWMTRNFSVYLARTSD